MLSQVARADLPAHSNSLPYLARRDGPMMGHIVAYVEYRLQLNEPKEGCASLRAAATAAPDLEV